MDNNQPKPQNQIQLELKPEVAKGSYSNLAIISHSRSEFIIDFATTLPGLVKPEIGSRIIMTPEHAKRLLNALSDNILKYEQQFGPIKLDQPFPGNLPPMGMGGQA
jgi:hypothetical protein